MSESDADHHSRGLVVVVVEDEPDLRRVLTEILEDEGFDVLSFSHPSHALQLDRTRKPALFLVDMMLPEMSGIELARRLHQGHFADTILIALSASSAMLQRARESRLFADTLQKPFDLNLLIETLRRHPA